MHFTLLSLAALASAAAAQLSLVDTAQSDPDLSTFLAIARNHSSLVANLESQTGLTVLAPTNEAFSEWAASALGKNIATSYDAVQALLSYHVLGAKVPASAFTLTPAFVPTLLTSPAYTNVTGGQVVEGKLNGTTIKITSGLLESSTVVKGVSSFLHLLQRTCWCSQDITWNGGLIHKIDKVLTFPQLTSTTAAFARLVTLGTALEYSGLVQAVDETKDVTVFAPTNEAFQKLGPAAANLTVDQVTAILDYHGLSPVTYSVHRYADPHLSCGCG